MLVCYTYLKNFHLLIFMTKLHSMPFFFNVKIMYVVLYVADGLYFMGVLLEMQALNCSFLGV